jgi:hypothetical protein
VFDEPEDVLRRDDLSREQKTLILRRWEHDARELETASDEGMAGEAPDRRDRVLMPCERSAPETAPAVRSGRAPQQDGAPHVDAGQCLAFG